jgi:hypothetical protein
MSQLFCFRLGGAGAALRHAIVAAMVLGAGLGAAKAADMIGVTLDQAKVLQLPENTATVIVGNPVIADITMLKKSNTIVLTGKSFGETNLIALDAQGKALGESIVRVSAADNMLIVQRGMNRESYSCAPRCQPMASLGDTNQFVTDVTSEIQSRNSLGQPQR